MSLKTNSTNVSAHSKLAERNVQRASVGLRSQQIQNEQQYEALARQARDQGCTHLPVVRETLADLDTPVSTYLKLANKPYSYLFESVQGGNKWGRYSIIGLPCDTVFRFQGSTLTTQSVDSELVENVDDPLQKIRELQAQYKVFEYPGLPEMIGGLVGYFGYETVAYIEPRLKELSNPDLMDTPDIMLLVSTEVLVFDNLAGRIYMVSLAGLDDESGYRDAQERLKAIEHSLRNNSTEMQASSSSAAQYKDEYRTHFEEPQFLSAVEKCREYIREGDIMQVVLSQRLSTVFNAASFDLYRALRTINPSPYMYFLNMGDFEIAGSSPEILVRLENDKVTVRPIAGTRKRGEDEAADLALESELLADEKEIAEHVMLIDLGRNDVGRIAEIGSVTLSERMLVERYSHVMHIVSNVEGKLKPEFDAIDVLKATFPAGTVSGAPKIRAMEIIAELEPCKRGIYSGAVGYLGWNGNMDTAISIRTAVIKDGVLNIQAGAGIVADSVPEFEWKETLSKARAIFKAVELVHSNFGLGELQQATPNMEEER